MVKHLGRNVTVLQTVTSTDQDKVQVQHADGTVAVVKQNEVELTEQEADAWFKAEQKKLQDRWNAWKASLKAKIEAAKKKAADEKKAAEEAQKPVEVKEQPVTQPVV